MEFFVGWKSQMGLTVTKINGTSSVNINKRKYHLAYQFLVKQRDKSQLKEKISQL